MTNQVSAPSAEALAKARAVILEHREDITDCEVAVALALDSHAAEAVARERERCVERFTDRAMVAPIDGRGASRCLVRIDVAAALKGGA